MSRTRIQESLASTQGMLITSHKQPHQSTKNFKTKLAMAVAFSCACCGYALWRAAWIYCRRHPTRMCVSGMRRSPAISSHASVRPDPAYVLLCLICSPATVVEVTTPTQPNLFLPCRYRINSISNLPSCLTASTVLSSLSSLSPYPSDLSPSIRSNHPPGTKMVVCNSTLSETHCMSPTSPSTNRPEIRTDSCCLQGMSNRLLVLLHSTHWAG